MTNKLDQDGEPMEGLLPSALDKGVIVSGLGLLVASEFAGVALGRLKDTRVGRLLGTTKNSVKAVFRHLGDDEDPWQD